MERHERKVIPRGSDKEETPGMLVVSCFGITVQDRTPILSFRAAREETHVQNAVVLCWWSRPMRQEIFKISSKALVTIPVIHCYFVCSFVVTVLRG